MSRTSFFSDNWRGFCPDCRRRLLGIRRVDDDQWRTKLAIESSLRLGDETTVDDRWADHGDGCEPIPASRPAKRPATANPLDHRPGRRPGGPLSQVARPKASMAASSQFRPSVRGQAERDEGAKKAALAEPWRPTVRAGRPYADWRADALTASWPSWPLLRGARRLSSFFFYRPRFSATRACRPWSLGGWRSSSRGEPVAHR
jgi:hypothetical protein